MIFSDLQGFSVLQELIAWVVVKAAYVFIRDKYTCQALNHGHAFDLHFIKVYAHIHRAHVVNLDVKLGL